VAWIQDVNTDKEVMANGSNMIIKNKKEACILTDVAIPADRHVMQKEAENKLKYKSLSTEIQRMWNMKCVIITSCNWSHQNSNKMFKEISGSRTRKTVNIFTTKDSYTWNITHNTESTAIILKHGGQTGKYRNNASIRP
jgi:hypothetical protein